MIDIHCHLLFGVDDGAKTIEESVAMLKRAKSQNVDKLILTPHYRHGMFAHPTQTILQNFKSLQPIAKQLGVEIALGTEYHVNSDILSAITTGRCFSLAGSKYVLCEYSHATPYETMVRMTREILSGGFIPVLAHVERYACIANDLEVAEQLRELGALIQVNADAVLGLEGRGPKSFCKKMLKAGWVDVIASDSHGLQERACHMKECQLYVEKKFGTETARKLFYETPQKIWSKTF